MPKRKRSVSTQENSGGSGSGSVIRHSAAVTSAAADASCGSSVLVADAQIIPKKKRSVFTPKDGGGCVAVATSAAADASCGSSVLVTDAKLREWIQQTAETSAAATAKKLMPVVLKSLEKTINAMCQKLSTFIDAVAAASAEATAEKVSCVNVTTFRSFVEGLIYTVLQKNSDHVSEAINRVSMQQLIAPVHEDVQNKFEQILGALQPKQAKRIDNNALEQATGLINKLVRAEEEALKHGSAAKFLHGTQNAQNAHSVQPCREPFMSVRTAKITN